MVARVQLRGRAIGVKTDPFAARNLDRIVQFRVGQRARRLERGGSHHHVRDEDADSENRQDKGRARERDHQHGGLRAVRNWWGFSLRSALGFPQTFF